MKNDEGYGFFRNMHTYFFEKVVLFVSENWAIDFFLAKFDEETGQWSVVMTFTFFFKFRFFVSISVIWILKITKILKNK